MNTILKLKEDMKFKVIKCEWFCEFFEWAAFFNKVGKKNVSALDCYNQELKLQKKDGRDYDGPLSYIEKCEDLPFPKREGLRYCVRANVGRKVKVPKSCKYYVPYQCYVYQLDCWWKYKELSYLFTEIHIPRMTHYEFTQLKCPDKFLSKDYQTDLEFYRRAHDLRRIYRDTGFYTMKYLKKNK